MDLNCVCSGRNYKLLVFLVVVVIALLTGCAEVGPPPGGPEDKSSPYIIGSSPSNGAISVEPGNTVILYFSEKIVRPPGKKIVFISPRLSEEPELKWKSDRLIIQFPDSFGVDQTYIISLSTDIADLRGNRLDSLTSVAFSTGATIDSGEVSGYVYGDDGPRTGILVALYDIEEAARAEVFDSLYPGYTVQTSASGQFAFNYLPKRHFRLIAFEDRNRDDRFSPGVEPFAIPDRPIRLDYDFPLDNLHLMMTHQDTATPAITAASYSAEGMVRIRLSGEIDLAFLRSRPENLILISHTDTSLAFQGQVLADSVTSKVSRLAIYMGRIPEGTYRIHLGYDSLTPMLIYDSLKVVASEDKKVPEMTFKPDNRARFLSDLTMMATFSEPLDTFKISEQTFQLFDTSGAQLSLSRTWQDPLRLFFSSPAIRAGGSYRIRVTEFDISDQAGNVMGDSLMEMAFSTINPDSTGSITGDVVVSLEDKKNDPIVLEFIKIDNQQTFTLPVSGPIFKIQVPAGKYFASGFIDSNANGKLDRGLSLPYTFSETVMSYPDTISVRARFETAGIDVIFK